MVIQDAGGRRRRTLLRVLGFAAPVIALVFVVCGHRRDSLSDPGDFVISAAMADEPVGLSGRAQAAADAASVKVELDVVKFYFAPGKADLADGAGAALAGLVKAAGGGRRLMVSGSHDATGDAVKNAGLARKRALAVRGALLAAGVAPRQIEIGKPELATGGGSDAEARRVEISLQP